MPTIKKSVRSDGKAKKQSTSRSATSAQTLAAVEEVKAMKKDPTVGKTYSTVREMVDDILK